ncbi:MAG: hypothetical protein KDD10_03810, partial [Phaeodactylibacter sp.]|nr:hypothetical protein [Phaeodactylibacter sp.]
MRYSVLVLVFMLYAGCLPGQSPGKAEWLSVNEGLSQGMIYDILQSRDGFLWIATKDGLNRYDGYRFEIFSPDPFDPFAIAASEVYCLFEDSRGWIWIRLSGKIEIYDPVSGRFFHLTEQVAPGLSKSVGGFSFSELADGALVFTDAGKIWKIAAPAGVLKKAASQGNAFPGLRGAVVEVSERAGISDGPVQFRAVHFTKNKVLLASSNQGLFRLDTAAGQLNLEAFPGLSTHILGESPDGRVWIQAARPGFGDVPGEAEGRLSGSEGPGLWIWKNTSEPPRNVGRPQPYKKCRFDHEGYLWALNDKELRKWRPMAFANGGQPEFEWASDDPLIQSRFLDFQCVAIDRSGIAWVGTTGYGILKANPEKPKFRSYLKGTSQRYLAEDPQGNLICAIDPAQIYPRQNFGQPETNPWLAGLPGKWRNFMPVFDETGNAWGIPEPNVLLRIDARAKTVRQYRWDGAGLSALLFCKNGTLLQASEEGLLQFDPATGQSRDFPFGRPQKLVPDSYYISNLYEDSEGIVWIIGFKGLIKAAPADGGYRYEYFKTDPSDPSSLSYNTVLSVAEDPLEPRRYLWAGTKSGGLNRLDRQTGKFKHYKKEDGLPDNVVYGVRSDNTGHIWLSTNKGLCRFHVREETTKNFTYADGLQDNEFNSSSYLKMKDGTLVFGGVRGLTIFHPDSLRFNEHKPQTHIVGLKANNRPLSEWTGSRPDIVLSHRRNLLTFEFAALEFTNPAQNLYRYQLIRHSAFGHEGEGRWVDLGARNNVQFANLRPGRYTFRVLGSNNDGAWGQDPAALRFAINPPWWATSRACLLYILCLSAMAWAFYKYQLGRRLERQETMRLRELDDFKNRFFTNITHEFRTPLTVILGMAEQVEPAVDEKLKPKIGLIRRNGQNLLRLINQI